MIDDTKIVSVMELVDVPVGEKKQEVVIGDQSGSCKVTLWDNIPSYLSLLIN